MPHDAADEPSADEPSADEPSGTAAPSEQADAPLSRAIGARGSRSSRHHAASAGFWALCAGYAWVMGASHPFTVAADTETAVAFVVVIGVAVVANVRGGHRGDVAVAVTAGPHSSITGGVARAEEAGLGDESGYRVWPWVVVLGAVLAWELFCYFAGFDGHRAAFPTISSLETAFSHWQAGRAVVVLAWMALGWRLVRR